MLEIPWWFSRNPFLWWQNLQGQSAILVFYCFYLLYCFNLIVTCFHNYQYLLLTVLLHILCFNVSHPFCLAWKIKLIWWYANSELRVSIFLFLFSSRSITEWFLQIYGMLSLETNFEKELLTGTRWLRTVLRAQWDLCTKEELTI